MSDRAFGCELELLCKRGSVQHIQAAIQEAEVVVSDRGRGQMNRHLTKARGCSRAPKGHGSGGRFIGPTTVVEYGRIDPWGG